VVTGQVYFDSRVTWFVGRSAGDNKHISSHIKMYNSFADDDDDDDDNKGKIQLGLHSHCRLTRI